MKNIRKRWTITTSILAIILTILALITGAYGLRILKGEETEPVNSDVANAVFITTIVVGSVAFLALFILLAITLKKRLRRGKVKKEKS